MAIKVMLDAGHGGVNPNNDGKKEPGIVANGYYECALTLQTAKLIKAKLEQTYDVEVLMTRTSDEYITLADRGKLAKDKQVDLFVSIHYNGFNTEASGYEDYVHTKANEKNVYIQQVIHEEIARYVTMNGIFDRGSKKEDFQVLRDTYETLPSILLEGLFIDNAKDVSKLSNIDYLDGYAEAVANGIAKALKLIKLTEQTSEFSVDVNGLLVGQYPTIKQATDKVVSLYSEGNTSDFGIVAKKSLPKPTVQKQKKVDFVGKSKGDGDKTREIWFTGDFSNDQISENIPNEVNSGYEGVSKKNDGKCLGLELDGVVGKQIQFEFAFDLSDLGTREEIAKKLSKVTFKVTPGETLDFMCKVYNPVSLTYKTLGTYSSGYTYEVYGNDYLNVRKTPEATGQWVGKLLLGDKVTVLGIDEYGWATIKFNGGMAYCSSTYLKKVGNTSDTFPKTELTYSISSDLLQYLSPNGILRFGIMSVDKTRGQIPVYVEVDHVELIVDYME